MKEFVIYAVEYEKCRRLKDTSVRTRLSVEIRREKVKFKCSTFSLLSLLNIREWWRDAICVFKKKSHQSIWISSALTNESSYHDICISLHFPLKRQKSSYSLTLLLKSITTTQNTPNQAQPFQSKGRTLSSETFRISSFQTNSSHKKRVKWTNLHSFLSNQFPLSQSSHYDDDLHTLTHTHPYTLPLFLLKCNFNAPSLHSIHTHIPYIQCFHHPCFLSNFFLSYVCVASSKVSLIRF